MKYKIYRYNYEAFFSHKGIHPAGTEIHITNEKGYVLYYKKEQDSSFILVPREEVKKLDPHNYIDKNDFRIKKREKPLDYKFVRDIDLGELSGILSGEVKIDMPIEEPIIKIEINNPILCLEI